MADPLSYKGKGLPHRTSRDLARRAGAKVPPLPSAQGYCTVHGHGHADGSCKREHDAADAASGGGASKLPDPPKPFKLGGGR